MMLSFRSTLPNPFACGHMPKRFLISMVTFEVQKYENIPSSSRAIAEPLAFLAKILLVIVNMNKSEIDLRLDLKAILN